MTTKREEREAIEQAMAEYRGAPEVQAPEVAIRKEQTRFHHMQEPSTDRVSGPGGEPSIPKDDPGREIAEFRARKKMRTMRRRGKMNAAQRKERLTTP